MGIELARQLLEAFHRDSRPAIASMAESLRRRGDRFRKHPVVLYHFSAGRREPVTVPESSFLLRTSVEYANPQVTLEELQGIVLSRLLEVSAEMVGAASGRPPTPAELGQASLRLAEPPRGRVIPFLMNVDDIEADRYSVNPLRQSIVDTGQSARAVVDVETEGLRVDPAFVQKYRGSLVAATDIQDIEEELAGQPGGSYLDFVDRTKYRQLERLTQTLGIDVRLPALRMPLSTLKAETVTGPVHQLISRSSADLLSIRRLYDLFNRDFGRRKTTLPAVPHTLEHAASKRLARGHLVVDGDRWSSAEVRYSPGPLYPNEVDPADIARGVAEGQVKVPAGRFASFDYRQTPASPQFALYMVASPEDGAVWHGVGKFAGVQIVQSYSSAHRATMSGGLFEGIPDLGPSEPPQWDLVAEGILRHPTLGNIDASVHCVEDPAALLVHHTQLRPLSSELLVAPTRGGPTE